MKKNKRMMVILVLISIVLCFNLYLNYHKEVIEINKDFKNAIVVEDDRIIENIDVKIKGTLYDTHFVYRYLKFSKELKGTVSIGSKKYYISASSVTKNGIIQGILTEDKDELVSDYDITLSKDLKQVCIYKGNYMISAPSKTLDEAMSIYKSIVDIPIN